MGEQDEASDRTGRAESSGYLLIVDDDQQVLRAHHRMFRSHLETVCAATVAEARDAIAARGPFYGAVLDFELPDGNGFDVLATFRSCWWTAPAIIVTGCVDSNIAERAGRLGASHAQKPVSSTVVRAFLARLPSESRTTIVERMVGDLVASHALSPAEAELARAIASDGASDRPSPKPDGADRSRDLAIEALVRKCACATLDELGESVWRWAACETFDESAASRYT